MNVMRSLRVFNDLCVSNPIYMLELIVSMCKDLSVCIHL